MYYYKCSYGYYYAYTHYCTNYYYYYCICVVVVVVFVVINVVVVVIIIIIIIIVVFVVITAKLSFGKSVPFETVPTSGISKITKTDFEYAKSMKSTIKLLG